jgi:hypothetical protein
VPDGVARAAAGVAGGAAGAEAVAAVPHRLQKEKSGSHGEPQSAQGSGCLRPHRGQKAKSADISDPQLAHAIG